MDGRSDRGGGEVMLGEESGDFEGLSAQRILDVTREIVTQAGLNAVSMRQIAARLNVTSTAIYYHFRNKATLLDRLAEDIVRGIELPARDRPWQERLRGFILAMHQAMTDYPGLNRHMVNNRNSGAALWWIETILGILKDAGFTPETIRPSFAMLVFFIDPMTLVDDRSHLDEVIHDAETITEIGSASDGFPHFATFVGGTEARTYKADYVLALDRIIAAIEREVPA
jgi:AcrR family transcriptional regulator